MEIKVSGAKSKKLEIADTIFACDFNEPLVHQVVTAYLAAGRSGNHAQKTRSEVRGGGIKPWRQKGTGRARAGTIRSPIWRKGGVTFAAKPTSYAQKVNKKMYRGALRSIFSELIRADRFTLVESLTLDSHKTKDFLKKLDTLKITESVLIITDSVEQNLYLAARNLPTVQIRDVAAIDPASLVGAERVLMTVDALKKVEELLK
ncbi:MAG TPA: 50S ribosomal protein L4 [Gammaproteobacteria bacterium]|jgi:large subunit ribosomal protein L4|nr:50S ribosomal protein L4 [Gammaproteobacteria bacterium]